MRVHVSGSLAAALSLWAMAAAAPVAAQGSGLVGNGGSTVANGASRTVVLPRTGLRLVVATPRGLRPPVEPSLSGTATVQAGTTPVSARWTRASSAGFDDPALARLADGAGSGGRHQQAAFIQSAINRAVRDGHRHSHWNAEDYWATAEETLRRGSGDCADIAVAKMQALRRLGFAPRDLYLIVGRVSGGEHAALLVRIDNRFWVLDDRHDNMVEASRFTSFVPMLTFGAGMTWIHGRRVAPSAASRPMVQMTAASTAVAGR